MEIVLGDGIETVPNGEGVTVSKKHLPGRELLLKRRRRIGRKLEGLNGTKTIRFRVNDSLDKRKEGIDSNIT